jgi:uncharacterized protein
MLTLKWASRIILLSTAVSLCAGQANVGVTGQSLQSRAESGDKEAQYEFGLTAKYRQDYAEAFRWIELAAKQGLPGAQVDLAFFYVNGLGVEKSYDEAFRWYRLAAAQGDPDAEYSVGVCYLHGEGVEQNLDLARKWLSLAQKHGDGARSVNTIGETYETGPHTDYGKALEWYLKAADMGYPQAQYNVCRLTAQGFASPSDYAGGINWCHTLADSGNEWGQFGMGQILSQGIGVQPDFKKAAEWYLKSAEQGNPPAQASLGALYSEGKGVPHDLVKAYIWFAIAGSGKFPDAQPNLEGLTAEMTEHQISEAQSLALEWLKRQPRDPEKSLDHIYYKPQ